MKHAGTSKRNVQEWKPPHYLKGGIRAENAFLLRILAVPSVDRWREDADVVALLESIRNLADGIVPFPFVALIVMRVGTAITGGTTRNRMRRLISVQTGMTWKQLSAFARRLRGIAEELERVNSSQYFLESDWIVRGTARVEIKRRKRFQLLPTLLKHYADDFESRINKTPPGGFIGKSKLLWSEVDRLSQLVKELTGRFKDRNVATLINNAAIVLGKDVAIDAVDLAIRRSRQKAKT